MHPDYAKIYQTVAKIPRGKVATYGQIAELAGLSRRARQVGYALHALPPGAPIPWQRVLGAGGKISLPGRSGARQRELLAAEGVEFTGSGRIDLARFGWRPRARPKASTSAPQRPPAPRPARPRLRPFDL